MSKSVSLLLILLAFLVTGCGGVAADARSAEEEDAWARAERLRVERRHAQEEEARAAQAAAQREPAEAAEAERKREEEKRRQEEDARRQEEERASAEAREREAKERMGNLLRAALDATDPDRAIEAACSALELDGRTHELSVEQRRTLQELLFIKLNNAFKAATSGSFNEAALAAWIAKKESLALPYVPAPADFSVKGYSGALDFAPVFVAVVAYAHCAKGDLSGCRALAERARSFRRVPFKQGATKRVYEDLLAKTDRALADSDPYAPGQYLTNQGFFQTWIGRIVERKGQVLRVRITYALGGSAFSGKRGQVVEFSGREVKPLTAVSADALLHGYQ